ncbi:hypothetical protein [Marinobacter mangrovi]|uniref:hypothetical protein n=1 Tax=Marinobacter mangrovi TaxID=2803918 RepID=UPI001933414B|nr:hypothetical protein [Marinobacter mangrovi]
MKFWKPLKAKTTLFETSAFWITVSLFGSAAFIFAVVKFHDSTAPKAPVVSKEFFEYLFANLSQPALIAGLSLPLLGLIASHLRSIQTKDQIEAQEQQNIFSNYSKHREFFTDLFKDEGLLSGDSELTGKAYELHSILYPDAQSGSLGPSSSKISTFHELRESSIYVLESCKRINWEAPTPSEKLFESLDRHKALMSKGLSLKGTFCWQTDGLPALSEILRRLTITHQHLAIAATFFAFNDCSKQFEFIHQCMEEAHGHIRTVQTEQNMLTQLTEIADSRQGQDAKINEWLESELVKFLSENREDKLAFIEQKLSNYENGGKTFDEVSLLSKRQKVSSEGYTS